MTPTLKLTQRGILALLLLLSFAGVARADDGARDSDSKSTERMLELNEQGFSAFGNGNFVRAAEKFEAAHEEVPDPTLRKNAAIAWFKAEKCEEASEAAVFFLLAEDTQRQDRREARSVLAHCYLDRAERAMGRGDIEEASKIVAWVEVLEVDSKVNQRLASMKMNVLQTRVSGGEGTSSGRVTAGGVLVGAGLALITGTVVYHIARDAPSGSDWTLPVLYGTGGVIATTGALLIYTGKSSPNYRRKKTRAMNTHTTEPRSAERALLGAPERTILVGWQLRF